MAIAEINTCPRKAFLHKNLASGIIKASILRSIAKDVILSSPFTIGVREGPEAHHPG